ncbi:hypothetical protein B9Z19DRAFT_430394 [Tuber borchii]|uniref:Uncharacterized protein n=1 Tax=Tuber borchii TaxID=42251 RepID=A0A2T7A3R5_TUBBO|nr:hypothetical protein B9Z19DRAFT_430394 [Tuber borchii]
MGTKKGALLQLSLQFFIFFYLFFFFKFMETSTKTTRSLFIYSSAICYFFLLLYCAATLPPSVVFLHSVDPFHTIRNIPYSHTKNGPVRE